MIGRDRDVPRAKRVTAPAIPMPDSEPALYVWTAEEEGNSHGACGVTDEADTAHGRLLEALRAMPSGGSGTIRRAWLDTNSYPYPGYDYGRILVRARRHETTGEISVRGEVR